MVENSFKEKSSEKHFQATIPPQIVSIFSKKCFKTWGTASCNKHSFRALHVWDVENNISENGVGCYLYFKNTSVLNKGMGGPDLVKLLEFPKTFLMVKLVIIIKILVKPVSKLTRYFYLLLLLFLIKFNNILLIIKFNY